MPVRLSERSSRLIERIGENVMLHHRVVCGDSATFQCDERDIIFLSIIADQRRKQSQTALQYEQRFNVALSRARDRMILVRSVNENDLNPNDLKARVLAHFREPMPPINARSQTGRLAASRMLAMTGSTAFPRRMVLSTCGGERTAPTPGNGRG